MRRRLPSLAQAHCLTVADSLLYAHGHQLYFAEGDGEQRGFGTCCCTERARLARTQHQLAVCGRATPQNPGRYTAAE